MSDFCAKYKWIIEQFYKLYFFTRTNNLSLFSFMIVEIVYHTHYYIFLDHPRIEPKSFVSPDIVQVYAKEYMFIGCIEYINKVKLLLAKF